MAYFRVHGIRSGCKAVILKPAAPNFGSCSVSLTVLLEIASIYVTGWGICPSTHLATFRRPTNQQLETGGSGLEIKTQFGSFLVVSFWIVQIYVEIKTEPVRGCWNYFKEKNEWFWCSMVTAKVLPFLFCNCTWTEKFWDQRGVISEMKMRAACRISGPPGIHSLIYSFHSSAKSISAAFVSWLAL